MAHEPKKKKITAFKKKKMKNNTIDKIGKCLRLAKSSNPHEAATAMRQAQALMKKHNITNVDVDLAQVQESAVTTSSQNKPPAWMVNLASVVSSAFGVEFFLRYNLYTNQFTFIGINPAAEVASYAFTILRRKLTNDRKDFVKKCRGKRINRIRKGDLFAKAWIYSVSKTVDEFAQPLRNKELISTYMSKHHSGLQEFNAKDCSAKRGDGTAIMSGLDAGKDIRLHHGMNGEQQRQLSHA